MQFEVNELARQPMMSMTMTTAPERIGEAVRVMLTTTWEHLQQAGVEPVGPPFCIYRCHDETAMQFELEGGWPVAAHLTETEQVKAGELPAGRAAVGLHMGPYEELGKAYEALGQWMAASGHTAQGDPRDVYLNDPSMVEDPSQYQTQIVQPIA